MNTLKISIVLIFLFMSTFIIQSIEIEMSSVNLVISIIKESKDKQRKVYNGETLWNNNIIFYVKNDKVNELNNFKSLFAKNQIKLNDSDINDIHNFIGYLSENADKYRSNNFNLVQVYDNLKYMRQKETSPYIERITSIIDEYTNDKNPSLELSIYIFLKNIKDQEFIKSIKITNPENYSWKWDYEDLNSNWVVEGYDGDKERFIFKNLKAKDTKSVPLGIYTITVVDKDNKTTEFLYTLIGRGDTNLIKGNIYSQSSNKKPFLLGIPQQTKAVLNNNKLGLEFTLKDEIINDVFIKIYNKNNSLVAEWDSFKYFFPDNKLNPTGKNKYILDYNNKNLNTTNFEYVKITCVGKNYEDNQNKIFYRLWSDFIKINE